MQYNYNPLIPITLQDHLTSGQVLRILIPNSNPARYYYLENHQRISPFDNIDWIGDGKGIYVIYQSGTAESSLRFWNAEGRSIWTKDHCSTYPPNGPIVPVFIEGLQSPSGKFDTEAISHAACYSGGSTLSPIEAFVSPITSQDVFQPLFAGDNNDMMKPGYVEVFNPNSNPSVEGVSFQVISESNQLKIVQKVESGTVYDTPPSKPQNLAVATSVNYHPYLTWDANQEPDIDHYKIWKNEGNGWQYYASIATAYFEDTNENYCQLPPKFCTGQRIVSYYVIAVDDDSYESVPSNTVSALLIDGSPEKLVVNPNSTKQAEYSLNQNYPNPFNPTTRIDFSVKEDGLTSLRVYDMLGREVASLVNEQKQAGTYSVDFNGNNLPSGIYFYTLTSSNFTATKKIILLK